MKLEDAPPPGWYPDPLGGGRLRWWEGTDWTDEYRSPPTATERDVAFRAASDVATGSAVPRVGDLQLRERDTEQIVSQVRDATRLEVSRAADLFSRRAQVAIAQSRSVVAEYAAVFLRWIKIAIVVGALLVIAWFIFQFIAQVTLFEWLGDRIDNVTGD
ncbi:MAG: DUF2510 domain-containing protein [Acidimicrobiia bacterium]|nr:DUF2510 domain-containing protein [Acidimicrobiia bacterium]